MSKGKYHSKNKLNDLTGRDWLLLTKSFVYSEKSKDDKAAFQHPAPFLIKDVQKFISLFTKKNMTVLDPFVGSGTTLIASHNINRKCIGIDLSEDYFKMAKERLTKHGIKLGANYQYIVGDALTKIDEIPMVDYVITSPPYHNILRNESMGIRVDASCKGYRSSTRKGILYYSDKANDLGNQKTYDDFLNLLKMIMEKAYKKIKDKCYCSIIISDFTVNKKEVCAQSDIYILMKEIGFEFVGTIALLQDNKPLYPFGYPYAFKINHMHQNIINFRKNGG